MDVYLYFCASPKEEKKQETKKQKLPYRACPMEYYDPCHRAVN